MFKNFPPCAHAGCTNPGTHVDPHRSTVAELHYLCDPHDRDRREKDGPPPAPPPPDEIAVELVNGGTAFLYRDRKDPSRWLLQIESSNVLDAAHVTAIDLRRIASAIDPTG